MDWTCILAPLSGGGADPRTLAVAKALAEPFSATVSAAYTSTPASELIPWVNEAGVSTTAMAIGELEQATRVGEAHAPAPYGPGHGGDSLVLTYDAPVQCVL